MKKISGDCFLQELGLGIAMMALSLRALSSREMQSGNFIDSCVTIGFKEHYSSIGTRLPAGSFLVTDFTVLCLQQSEAGNCFVLHWKEEEEGVKTKNNEIIRKLFEAVKNHW